MNDDTFFTDSLGQKWRKDYFTYNCSVTALVTNTSQNAIINIESDSQFVWTKTSYVIALNGSGPYPIGSRPFSRVGVSVTDSGSGRQLQSAPTILSSFAGSEGLPFVLPQPRLFKENSSISVTFNNPEALTYDIYVAFSGYKLFRV